MTSLVLYKCMKFIWNISSISDQTFELPEAHCWSELIGQAVPHTGRLEPKWSLPICDSKRAKQHREKGKSERTKRQIIWILGQRGGDQGLFLFRIEGITNGPFQLILTSYAMIPSLFAYKTEFIWYFDAGLKHLAALSRGNGTNFDWLR